MPPVNIRPARPDDVEVAVPLILSAGPKAFAYVFTSGARHTAAGFLHHAFPTARGQFGLQHHLVAELEGRIVGTAAAYTGREARTFGMTAFFQFVAHHGLFATPGVVARGLSLERMLPPPRRGELMVCHLGVAPEVRGRGIGTRLFLEAIARRGPDHVPVLDVALDNPRAQALYERLGFEVVAERASTLVGPEGPVPGHRRMRLGPEGLKA